MKGFAISLDAVIALSFVLFAMMIIATQSYYPKAPGEIYLKQLTLDVVTVLEKTGRMNQAIDGNSSAIQELLETTPKLACIEITIVDTNEIIVSNITKSDCTETTDLDIQITASPLLYKNNNYIIKSETWLRKEQ
ncbi:MAG: hypothetical protein ABID61_05255 [Candidatus Micrarchaeota archaeon]